MKSLKKTIALPVGRPKVNEDERGRESIKREEGEEEGQSAQKTGYNSSYMGQGNAGGVEVMLGKRLTYDNIKREDFSDVEDSQIICKLEKMSEASESPRKKLFRPIDDLNSGHSGAY